MKLKFYSQLFLSVWPGTSHFTSVGLSDLIYNMWEQDKIIEKHQHLQFYKMQQEEIWSMNVT